MGGLVHFYYGDGKGKTTAAMGLAVRALGQGRRVLIVQFMKSSASGEVAFFAQQPGVRVLRNPPGSGWATRMGEAQRAATRGHHTQNMNEAFRAAQAGECDLLILDEVADAVQSELLDGAPLFDFLRAKPEALELVMTGHIAEAKFLECADYVTEMKKHRHPYDRGVRARQGIEY